MKFSLGEAARIIEDLAYDDAADLMDEMPANVVTKLLAHADPETRRDINHLLQYPEDSAGSLMTVEYVSLKEGITVSEAIAQIREDIEVLRSRRLQAEAGAVRQVLLRRGQRSAC